MQLIITLFGYHACFVFVGGGGGGGASPPEDPASTPPTKKDKEGRKGEERKRERVGVHDHCSLAH